MKRDRDKGRQVSGKDFDTLIMIIYNSKEVLTRKSRLNNKYRVVSSCCYMYILKSLDLKVRKNKHDNLEQCLD